MQSVVTTKPGDKYRSLRWPALYEKLRSRGYSKESAARISNAQARKRKKEATVDHLEQMIVKGYPSQVVQAFASLIPALPRLKGEQIAPGITRIRGNLCNVHGRYGRCPGAQVAPTKPAAKPKKGRPARKPAKTPEQRAAEQDAKKRERETERTEADAEKRAQRDKLLSDAGLDNQTRDALVDARAGDTLASINGQKLAGMGLAEQATDGSYRLTAAGRETVNAALRGDAGRVSDTISRARDAAAKRGAPKPEKAPKGGGGGGKGKQPPAAKPAKQTDTRAQILRDAARRARQAEQGLAARLRATRQKAAFAVFKDAQGRDRWLSVTTTAYQDRDREWISRKAIVGAVEAGDRSYHRGPLRFWHVPGLDLGTCDYQATAQDGRFLIESGTFKHAVAARIGTRAAERGYQMSPGFVHPADEPRGGVFDHITIFERSIVPAGRASNPFTRLVTKGTRMLTDEKKKEFEALAGDAESRQFLTDLLSTVQATDKAAQEQATYKDAPDWAQALIARMDALETREKAAPPFVTEEQEETVVEEKVDGELMVEEESAGGLTLSTEDLQAIAETIGASISQALAPLAGMLDIEKKMQAHVQSVMGGYQTQKDAQDAERAQQITDLQTTLKATQDKLAELLGETPAAYKGHRITDNPIVSETRKEQLISVPPTAADFDPIVAQLAGNGVKLPGT